MTRLPQRRYLAVSSGLHLWKGTMKALSTAARGLSESDLGIHMRCPLKRLA